MTEREFLQDINDYYDLITFCEENDCDICDDIIDLSTVDEHIEHFLFQNVNNYGWREIRDKLYDIRDGYDWYWFRGIDSCEPLDDYDFGRDKERVCNWALDNDVFDDEGEGNEEDVVYTLVEEPGEEPEEAPEEEDFSISELIGVCAASLETIQSDSTHRVHADVRDFEVQIGVLIS